MSENEQKLQINKTHKQNSNEAALGNEVDQIEKNIDGLEKNISDLESKREMRLGELADEKNYDLFFYIGGGLVLLNVIFRFNIPGLVIAFVFAGMFSVYKKYFNKEKRAAQINADVNQEIDVLKGKVEERRDEIGKAEKGLRETNV